jgi:hypothetical protein
MPDYLLLVYENEEQIDRSERVQPGVLEARYQAFIAEHGGAVKQSSRLHSSSSATSLRREGSHAVTIMDGVFAEAKEVIGGFFVIEADDLDAALSIARELPAPFGGVEVRPIRGN